MHRSLAIVLFALSWNLPAMLLAQQSAPAVDDAALPAADSAEQAAGESVAPGINENFLNPFRGE